MEITQQLKEPFSIKLYKLYTWSIIFEPLLFFVVFKNSFGFGGNISRVLQLIFLSLIGIKFLINKVPLSIPNPFDHPYRYYFLYLLYALLITLASSFLTSEPSQSESRPFGEFIISIYYFIYFIVFSFYVLNNEESINYFFKIFNLSFLLCISLGLLELIIFFLTGVETLPRHIVDLRGSGFRFNGLAGEPRDAFPYLLFGISIYVLHNFWSKEKISLRFLFIILLCLLLTVSASGLLALIIFPFFLFSYFLIPIVFKVPLKRLLIYAVLAIFMILIFIYMISSNERLNDYYMAINLLFSALENGYDLPDVIMGQMPNIYPFWHRWEQIDSVPGLLNIIFGSGLGSTSIINNVFSNGEVELLNPHSGVTRLFYETGLVGSFLFFASFISPLKNINIDQNYKKRFIWITFLLLSAYLAHRSATLFIFLGICLSVINVRYKFETTET